MRIAVPMRNWYRDGRRKAGGTLPAAWPGDVARAILAAWLSGRSRASAL